MGKPWLQTVTMPLVAAAGRHRRDLCHAGAVVIAAVEPMLATRGRPSPAHRWAVEPKRDGWRALVYVDERVTVRTRSGRLITESVPELAGLSDVLGGRQALIDGELVAGQGRPCDFYRLAPSLASRRTRSPVTFVAFDVLYLDGDSLLDRPYADRRRLLEDLGLVGPAWHTTPAFVDGFVEVVAACEQLGLEGVVLKRLDSRYRPGHRSREWLKLKTAEWREVHAPLRHER